MPTLSKNHIADTFDHIDQRIWSRTALLNIIEGNLEGWGTDLKSSDAILAKSSSQKDLIQALLSETPLQLIELDFPYRKVSRYVWKEVPTYNIVQSVDERGYFSHYSAMQIHGLTEQIPKSLYFNVEQPATGGGGSLSQQGIDRAFKGKCRVSNNVIEFRDFTIRKLNGQNTGRLGVESVMTEDRSTVEVTNLERTLIDIAVRPIYSGGIGEVANAYKAAASKVSGNRLATYLKSLNYTYPYHQAIGFYMERASNYKEPQLAKLKNIPIEFDFYLTYQLKNPVLDEAWRLFIPKGF